jgi:DNA (cytosine-5)-methyltransferase 1
MKNNIPVIDLFAGPGGLGEGFAKAGFDIVLSIEMDATACNTLRLRKFYSLYKDNSVPKLYYDVIRGDKPLLDLQNKYAKEWKVAASKVLKAEIGTNKEYIYSKISEALKGYDKKKLIVIGGPPCQAYSLAGRSARLGLGDKYNQIIKKFFLNDKIDALDNDKKLEKIINKKNNPNTSKEDKISLQEIENYILKKNDEFYKDSKHKLYEHYLNIIEYFQPVLFVMENVKGINSAIVPSKNNKKIKVLDKILNDINDLGYKTLSIGEDKNSQNSFFKPKDFLIKCENYGIPQRRHRVIIIGLNNSNNKNINIDTLKINNIHITVKDMIDDMPILRSGLSKGNDTYENWLNTLEKQLNINNINELDKCLNIIKNNKTLTRGKPFLENDFKSSNHKVKKWIYDKKLNGVIQHTTRSHMESDLIRYMYSSWFSNKKNKQIKIVDWPIQLRPMHKNISVKNNKLSTSSHVDRFKVQSFDAPSNTITSHISKDGHYFIHPDATQCRSFTPREAARLQTFPENYYFFGGRTSQYHQIGNAVPPYLAYQIAILINDAFNIK